MTLKELIHREGRLRYPNWEQICSSKGSFLDFCLHMMEVAEKEGEFASLVKQMREEQKAYFRSRTKSSLDKSKELESQVDLHFSPPKSPYVQQGLF
jgi:hypothetical protein